MNFLYPQTKGLRANTSVHLRFPLAACKHSRNARPTLLESHSFYGVKSLSFPNKFQILAGKGRGYSRGRATFFFSATTAESKTILLH